MPTKTEMLANVRSRLADASIVRFSDAEVKVWLLKGYQRVVRLLQAHRSPILHYHPVDNTYSVPLSSFSDGTNSGLYIYRTERVWWKTATDAKPTLLRRLSYDELIARDNSPEFADSGVPELWCMRDPNTIQVYPPVDVVGAAQHFIYLQGLSVPVSWDDATNPVLNIDHQELIEFWTCATMLTNTINDEGNNWRANAFGKLFWEGIVEARSDVMTQDGPPRLGTGEKRRYLARYDFEAENGHILGP